MTKADSQAVIDLLTQVLEAQRASAVVLAAIQSELAAPRLAREALRIQQVAYDEQRQCEAELARKTAELKRAEARRNCVWVGGAWVLNSRVGPPLPEGDDP